MTQSLSEVYLALLTVLGLGLAFCVTIFLILCAAWFIAGLLARKL